MGLLSNRASLRRDRIRELKSENYSAREIKFIMKEWDREMDAWEDKE